MVEVAIMIEGQEGLTWARWARLAQAVEEMEFAGLYRSDHFVISNEPPKESLELWVSLTWLASHTRRIEFGPLVSPFSFRDPVFTARMALQVDDLSGGRLRLGLGAGWNEREHAMFGYDLLEKPQRFQRFEEGLEVVSKLLKSDSPVDFSGQFYRLNGAILLPRPQRPAGPPIVLGGNGVQRTLPLVARYADEWNAVEITAEKFRELNAKLDDMLRYDGREPASVKRSMMTGLEFGRDEAELKRKLGSRSADELRARGVVVGVAGQVAEQVQALADAGVQRLMLRWNDLDEFDGLVALRQAVGG